MAGARFTRTRLLAGTAQPGGIRLTKASLLAGTAQPGGVRITRFRMIAAIANQLGYGERVTYFRLLRAQSLNRVFYLGQLASTSTINALGTWQLELVAGQIPEINPYKPQVPETLINIPGTGRDLFDYIEENQKTLRLQHNITQAGDTTFPHEMIINSHDVRQFKLGSVGRFYHEDYGIIHARYVQFEKMNPDLVPTAPVGLIKLTGKLDWIVTNRLEISDPRLVVGVQAAYLMPTDGQFGWVTVDGVNLQSITTEGVSTAIGTPYVWSASGKVGPEGEGVVICRRLEDGGDVTLLKGRALIRLEGASFGSIDIHFSQLLADVEQLKTDVALLKEASEIEDTIKAIQDSLKTLGLRINLEQSQRQASDTAINNRIDALEAVSPTELEAEITLLRTQITTIAEGLSTRIDAVNLIAVEALEKANQALSQSLAGIEQQITDILTLISEERLRVKGRFPLVDGSVPPNLVYLDDGSLVYVETF